MMSKFAQALTHLLPTGFAWPRHPDSVMMRWVAGVASSFDEFERFCLQTAQQWLPHRTCSRTPEWEAALGLPDACIGYVDDPVLSRSIMLSRLQGSALPHSDSAPAAIDLLQQTCRTAGYEVAISYSGTFRVGRNRTGEHLGRNGILNIQYPEICEPFRVGDNFTGQRLIVCPTPPKGLVCLLNRIVPARFEIYIYP